MSSENNIFSSWREAVLFSCAVIAILSAGVGYLWHEGSPFPVEKFSTLNSCVANYVKEEIEKEKIVTNSLVSALEDDCVEAEKRRNKVAEKQEIKIEQKKAINLLKTNED
jgi:hypothetical protein